MKKQTLFLLLSISMFAILNAKEAVTISVNAICSESENLTSNFSIKISSNILNLSEDAIQDNVGGYVDIPEDKYYLKTSSATYRLNGVTEYNDENNINQFTSYIDDNTIKVKELYALRNSTNLTFIQKINLEKSSKTNNLNVYFDTSLFEKEYKRCEEKVQHSEENSYLLISLAIFFILLILYFFKRSKL